MFEPLPNYYKVIEEIEREKQMEESKQNRFKTKNSTNCNTRIR